MSFALVLTICTLGCTTLYDPALEFPTLLDCRRDLAAHMEQVEDPRGKSTDPRDRYSVQGRCERVH